MPNTVRRPDDDRRRWEAQRRRQREEAERREQARTSRDRRQRTTQLERQSLMGPMDLPFLLLTLLLTGGGGKYVTEFLRHPHVFDPDLTRKGLAYLYRRNHPHRDGT